MEMIKISCDSLTANYPMAEKKNLLLIVDRISLSNRPNQERVDKMAVSGDFRQATLSREDASSLFCGCILPLHYKRLQKTQSLVAFKTKAAS